MARGQIAHIGTALAQAANLSPDAAAKVRELAARDVEELWNGLKRIALWGEWEGNRIEANRILMAYALGLPSRSIHVEQTHNTLPPEPQIDLNRFTTEELQALKIIMEAKKRLLNGG